MSIVISRLSFRPFGGHRRSITGWKIVDIVVSILRNQVRNFTSGRSETLVSHGSTKKDRKTKEFPRIEGTVFENGIGVRHGR
jgi:hypothetical protein